MKMEPDWLDAQLRQHLEELKMIVGAVIIHDQEERPHFAELFPKVFPIRCRAPGDVRLHRRSCHVSFRGPKSRENLPEQPKFTFLEWHAGNCE
jgi:hypothetical protein